MKGFRPWVKLRSSSFKVFYVPLTSSHYLASRELFDSILLFNGESESTPKNAPSWMDEWMMCRYDTFFIGTSNPRRTSMGFLSFRKGKRTIPNLKILQKFKIPIFFQKVHYYTFVRSVKWKTGNSAKGGDFKYEDWIWKVPYE